MLRVLPFPTTNFLNGLRPPATVVGMAEDGLLHLEYYQDGLRVVNRQCKMESISFAIPSSHSPPDCPPWECHARSAHAVRTQCKVLDVGQYSNPSFGPF